LQQNVKYKKVTGIYSKESKIILKMGIAKINWMSCSGRFTYLVKDTIKKNYITF
jgi:hypothetical protein